MYRMCGFLSRNGLDMLPIDVVGLQGGPTRTVRLAAQQMTCRQVQLKLHVLIIIFTLIMILLNIIMQAFLQNKTLQLVPTVSYVTICVSVVAASG